MKQDHRAPYRALKPVRDIESLEDDLEIGVARSLSKAVARGAASLQVIFFPLKMRN